MPPSPTAYPLDAPTVSGNTVTVDTMLNNPSRMDRTIANLATSGRFFAPRIFSPGPGVEGGAVLFERPPTLATDLYASRDVQEVAPGEEFPILTFDRGVPLVANPRKIGGKWFVTKEARKRNDVRAITRAMTQTANTITRKTEQMAVAALEAVVTSDARTRTGISWSAAAATTFNTTTKANQPLADLVETMEVIDLEERGHVMNGMVLHPSQTSDLIKIYGADGIDAMFSSVGINEWFSTPRVTAGSAYIYEAGAVGEWRNEFPLEGEVDEEGVAAGGRQRTWYQWSISPTFIVDDQYAFLKLVGIA
jgi:hypothetical protein